MQYLFMSAVMSVALLYSCFQANPTAETEPAVSPQPTATTVAHPTTPPAVAPESTTAEPAPSEDAAAPADEAPAPPTKVVKNKPTKKLSTAAVPSEQPKPQSEPFPDEEAEEPQGQAEPFPDEENPRTVDLPKKDLPQATKVIDAKPNFALSHDQLDVLLRRYVSSSGKVDYKSFKKDKPALEAYLNLLQNNAPKSDWSKNKTMAYWINLYNAFTIKTILDAYPVKSIMDIDGGKVWD